VKRVLLGLVVLVHGCAHAAIGVWALGEGSPWVVTPLWAAAMLGYFGTGLGILRVPLLRAWWKQLLIIATAASLILLLVFSHGLSLIGALVDVVIVVVALERQQRCIDSDVDVVNALGTDCFEHPALHRAMWAMSVLALVYAAAVLAIRPLYRVDHALTIHAPASTVWPSLVKFGEEGGWRVENAVPQRTLVLENSVSFVLEAIDSKTTRLVVRRRAPGAPSFAGLVLGAVNVFMVEPAQFLSQRGMLRVVRDRAEHGVATASF
jgi:hypothetical protein